MSECVTMAVCDAMSVTHRQWVRGNRMRSSQKGASGPVR